MRKNFIKTIMTLALVGTMFASVSITTFAAEVVAKEKTSETVLITAADKAVLKTIFDAKYYAERYPDVVAAFGNDETALFNHYVNSGINEGRDASSTFNATVYALANPDLVTIYGSNLGYYVQHYVSAGMNEGRVASTENFVKMAPAVRAAAILQTAQNAETVAPNFVSTMLNCVPSTTSSLITTINAANHAGDAEKSINFATAYSAWVARLGGENIIYDLGNGNSFTSADWAKQEAYANQKIFYNVIDGTTQAYGTTVYGNIDEFGGRIGNRVDSNGVSHEVYNATSEQFDARAAAMGLTVVESVDHTAYDDAPHSSGDTQAFTSDSGFSIEIAFE